MIFDDEARGRKALEELLDSSKPRYTRALGSDCLCWIIRLRQWGQCRSYLCQRLNAGSVIACADASRSDTHTNTDTDTHSTADTARTYPNAGSTDSSTQERKARYRLRSRLVSRSCRTLAGIELVVQLEPSSQPRSAIRLCDALHDGLLSHALEWKL